MGPLGALDDQFEPLAAPLDHPQLEAVAEIQGGAEAIETRADVGSGGRNRHHHPLADLGPDHK